MRTSGLSLRVRVLACLAVVLLGACGGSSAKTSDTPSAGAGISSPETTNRSGGSTATPKGTACTFLDENEVTSLFGTRPQQTSDPYGIGGAASNCLWKADAGGEQFVLQIAFFNGVQHYEQSDKFGAANLVGLGDKAFITKDPLGGVTIEFVRASNTYFVLFSIAKTVAPTKNDADAKADQLVAVIKQNLSRL